MSLRFEVTIRTRCRSARPVMTAGMAANGLTSPSLGELGEEVIDSVRHGERHTDLLQSLEPVGLKQPEYHLTRGETGKAVLTKGRDRRLAVCFEGVSDHAVEIDHDQFAHLSRRNNQSRDSKWPQLPIWRHNAPRDCDHPDVNT